MVRGEISIQLSVAMALECEAVVTREVHFLAGQKSRLDAMLVVDALIAKAKLVDVHFRWRPQLRDPDDEMVLEAAINAETRTIVTFNFRDFAPAADRFRIRVAAPRQILEKLK